MLLDWYATQHLAVAAVDADREHPHSLAHFFPDTVRADINALGGLDPLIDLFHTGASVTVGDLPSGARAHVARWLNEVYEGIVTERPDVRLTAVCMVTPDPASVTSLLGWANTLQSHVDYLIVRNSTTKPASFRYWEKDEQAQTFRSLAHPCVMAMEHRTPSPEYEAKNHGLTLCAVAEGKTAVSSLQATVARWRAQSYIRSAFAEFERVKGILLP